MRLFRMLRTVALYEAAKGVLVLMLGAGLFSLLHKNFQEVAEQLVFHFHLNPDAHYSRIFLQLARQMNDGHLWWLVSLTLVYAAARFVEAYGLWHARRWAEWFAALSGAVYIPFEVREVLVRVNWLTVTTLLLNLLIVAFMIYGLRHDADLAAERNG